MSGATLWLSHQDYCLQTMSLPLCGWQNTCNTCTHFTLCNGLKFDCRSRNIPDLNKDRGLKKLVGFDAQKFSQAPAHVMHATLQHIRHRYGSPRTYLAEACGFSVREQQALAKALRSGKSMM